MTHRPLLAAALAIVVLAGCSSGAEDNAGAGPEQDLTAMHLEPTVITLPHGGVGTGGIGIDDLGFFGGRIVVPAGRTGDLDVVDPVSLKVTAISGFSVEKQFHGSHDFGATSVTEANGLLYVGDRTNNLMKTVDPKKAKVVGTPVKFAASPDYLRAVESLHEIWVTEPDKQQIEIFTLSGDGTTPVHSAVIAIDGDGPESIVIDRTRGRAYTNLFSNVSLAIDLKSRKVVDRFANACAKNGTDPNDRGSRGIALDEQRGLLMVACSEGLTSVIDVKVPTGKQLGQAKLPGGLVDIIAYDATLHHLYAATETKLVFLGLTADGALTQLGVTAIPDQARSAVVDGKGNVYVGDQKGSGLLRYKDPFAATK